MKAIEILQEYWEQIKRAFVYSQYCVENPIQTTICRDFWMWTVYASVGLALLVGFIIAKTTIKEQLDFYRNKKRLSARSIVADAETIEQARWKGEDDENVVLSQEALAAKIRAAVTARAESEARASSAGANLDK